MALKPKNPDIGTCPCITCSEVCPVRKNRSGRLYVTCPTHGVYSPRDQEWILENATLWPGGKRPAEPEPDPGTNPGNPSDLEASDDSADPPPADDEPGEPEETPRVDPDPNPGTEPEPDPGTPEDPPAGPGRNFRQYLSDLDEQFEEFFSQ